MSASRLDQALGELLSLCDPDRAATVRDLTQRLALGQVRVLLVGEAKRGKSTLGNALLGREILPTGVTPLTAISTTVTAGRQERVEVRYQDGRTEQAPLSALGDFVTETGNPQNIRSVDRVSLVLATGLPVPGMSLVDTPGVGSVFGHNSDEARAALERMELAVFVLTADPPISASEAALLQQVRERAVATFVVLNKADRLAPAELVETLTFLGSILPGVEVLPCSARDGLSARLDGDAVAYRASGVGAVADAITGRLASSRLVDLETSIAAGARRVIDSLADETEVTRAALDSEVTSDRDRVAAFRTTLEHLPHAAAQATTRVSWLLDELRSALTSAATEASIALTHQARAGLDGLLILSGHAGVDPDRLRDDGEQRLQEVIRDGVTVWRQEWAARINRRLNQIAEDEQGHLDDSAQTVRESAEHGLGVRLRVRPLRIALADQGRFRFDFADPVGWEAPLAGVLRRHTPGPVARRRTVNELGRRALDLPDKHIGRARHDLDQRLTEAGRGLTTAISTAYHDLGSGLSTALDVADAASSQTLTEVTDRRQKLLIRGRKLAQLGDDLDLVGL